MEWNFYPKDNLNYQKRLSQNEVTPKSWTG